MAYGESKTFASVLALVGEHPDVRPSSGQCGQQMGQGWDSSYGKRLARLYSVEFSLESAVSNQLEFKISSHVSLKVIVIHIERELKELKNSVHTYIEREN